MPPQRPSQANRHYQHAPRFRISQSGLKIMAALLASRFPEKAPELFAYQASIVRAERNFNDRRWVAYDPLPRCSFCLQEDHVVHMCPRNPNRS